MLTTLGQIGAEYTHPKFTAVYHLSKSKQGATMSEESRKEQLDQNSENQGADSSPSAPQTFVANEEVDRAHQKMQGEGADQTADWEASLEELAYDSSWDQRMNMSLADVSKLTSTSDVRGRHHHFQSKRAAFWQSYANRGADRSEPVEENLHFFGDWSMKPSQRAYIDWPEQEINTSGLFFRWNGLGVALNPCGDFLRDFHKRDLFIGDLHAVISTRADAKVHEMLEQIYQLNATYNEVSENKHKIDYYLCAGSHKELFHRLEPRYKQERNSVFCLERYVDSDEVESYALGQGVDLFYSYHASDAEAGIVLQLELPTAKEQLQDEIDLKQAQSLKLGYLPKSFSNSPPNALFDDCHLLIISLNTFKDDKNAHDHSGLSADLNLEPLVDYLQKARPKVTLLSDFSINDGDLRLEMAKHLKALIGEKVGGELIPILPADGNLQLEMATWRVRCAVTGHWIPAPFANVIRTQESFGHLMYLGSDCVL